MATSAAESAQSGPSSHKSPAQLLQEQEDAAEAHHPTVEDAVDEEDLEHPPPSQAHHDNNAGGGTDATSNSNMSSKAAGKQKAPATTLSEENFPALGGGPKAQAPAAKAPSWAAKTKANGGVNGTSNAASASSGASSPLPRALTPSSSVNMPIRPQQYGQAPKPTTLPGKHRDELELLNSQIDKSKPLKQLLQSIKSNFGVVVTTEPANYGRSTRFVASGRQESVHKALRQISKELTPSIKARVEIPSSLRSHIIGRQGSNITELQRKSGARIQVQSAGSSGAPSNDEDTETAVVEIQGDAAAVQIARAAILEQVNARTSNVNLRLNDVPPEFFPFLENHPQVASARQSNPDLNIHIPPFLQWQQPPPRVSRREERPAFVAHPNMHINIAGERNAAMQARQQIEALVQQLTQQLTLEEQTFRRGQHQFIVGDRGVSPQEFLQETGCIVVLPPDHDDTEEVVIIGPPDRLDEGIEKAMALAAEMNSDYVDPRKYFTNAPQGADAHVRALALYLRERQLEADLLKRHNTQISFPPASNPSLNWDIFSKDRKDLVQARSDVNKVIQAHPPARLNLVPVDPYFHPHLRRECADDFRENLGVHMILPEDDNSIVLVYEGKTSPGAGFQLPRDRPSEDELAVFQEALQQAQNRIIGFTEYQKVSSREIPVPRKFHDKVRKYVGREQAESPQSFPVETAFGPASAGTADGTLQLRGPDASVDEFERKILAFLQQVEEDEKERGHVTSFDFPSKFNNYLIGAKGQHINSLRERHDVEIDTKEDGKVHIKGPVKNATACKAEIQKLAKQWEDEVTHTLTIEPQFHGDLIGKKGANLTRLQEKTNNEVRIQFPRLSNSADDQSTGDTASEAGGNRHARGTQPANSVVIRGPRKKADEVKEELWGLYQYAKDNSYSATISVAKSQIPSLMGRGGSQMEQLRLDTGASIDVPNAQAGSDDSGRVTIQIKGSKKAVDAAKSELSKKAKAYDEIVTRTLNIDKKHHQALIGKGGSNIKAVVEEAGGPANSAEAVKFPGQGDDSTAIRVQGTAPVVDKICAALEKLVTEKESQVAEEVDVPSDKHRLLIGRGGDIRRSLEQKFQVSLDVPRKESGKTNVRVTGRAAEVQRAVEHIKQLTKSTTTGPTIMVPKSLHHHVSQDGRLFRQLRGKGVKIDHDGQRPPPKPEPTEPQARANGAAPLITDDEDPDNFSWHVVEAPGQAADEGTIPWVLSGESEEAIAHAKSMIEKALESAAEPKATGYLILPDPRLHGLIIGPGGSTIKSIRKETGCEIQVPRAQGNGSEGEAITIVGSKDGCEQAKDLIRQRIREGQNGGGRPSSRD